MRIRPVLSFLLTALLLLGWGAWANAAVAPANPGSTVTKPGIVIPGSTINLFAPGNLTAQSNEVGKVVLHWNDNSASEAGFAIERKSGSMDSFFQIDYVGANTTSYEQSEMSSYPVFPGETYYYRVKAFTNSTSSGYSNEVLIQVKSEIASPTPPEALRARAMTVDGRATVRLFWADKANNESKYVVQRSKANEAFVVAGELPANSYKFEEPANLERNVKYTYRVIAYNAGGAGVSNTADVVIPVGVPADPVFNPPQTQGSSAIKLTWIDNSNNEDGFKLTRYGEYEEDLLGNTPPDKEYMLDPNSTSFLVTDLRPGWEYSFRLVAFNTLGNSGIASRGAFTGPAAPASVAAIAVSSSEIKISWESTYQSKGYSIERKRSGEAYIVLASPGQGDRSFNDKPLQTGTKYTYRIRSWFTHPETVNLPVWSDYSSEVSVSTPPQGMSNAVNQSGAGLLNIDLKLGVMEYQVNGQTLQMDAAPVSLEGRTMLPVKYLTDPLGARLSWDGAAQKVTISFKEKVIELRIGKNTALVNGKEMLIDPANPAVAPVVVPPGRTLMPIGFISKNLGCEVKWDAATQTASLTYTG